MRHASLLALVIVAVSATFLPTVAHATSYYVDCVSGVDGSNTPGTSPTTAWRSLARVSAFVYGTTYIGNSTLTDAGFNPGDSLFLMRGCTWDWHVTFAPYSAGLNPPTTATGNFNGGSTTTFTIDAYGTTAAPATIQGEIVAPFPVQLSYSGLVVSSGGGSGSSTITLSASSATGVLVPNNTFQIAGDSTIYTVTNTVTAVSNVLTNVTVNPTFAVNETAGASVNATGWYPAGTHIYQTVVTPLSEPYYFHPYRVDMVKIGSSWGRCRGMNVPGYCTTTGGTSALAADGDWYYNGNYNLCNCANLYVYSDTGVPSSVTAVLDGAGQLFYLNGVSNVTVQHVRLLNYSWFGIEVYGGADHLRFANFQADTEVPFNYHGVGFYYHSLSGAATDIQVLGAESDRGYYGYEFCDPTNATCVSGTGIKVSNSKAYFNRNAGLADMTGAATVNYDHCHFYGNGVGSVGPNDTTNPTGGTGGVPGAGNIAPSTDPHITAWQQYLPRMVLNYQDVGVSAGADTALNAQLSSLGGAPLSIGIATNFPLTTSLISQINTWIGAGYDINSQGLSDASYQKTKLFNLTYTGPGSATVTVTGTPATNFTIVANSVTVMNQTITSTMTMQALKNLIPTTFNPSWVQPCGSCGWARGSAMLAQDFATVSAHALTATPYTLLMNPTQFLDDELGGSKAWMIANLTAFSSGSTFVYLYPGVAYDGTTDATVAAYMQGARGATNMELDRDGLSGAYDAVASNGVDVQGLATFALAAWKSLSPAQLQAQIQETLEKSAVWGVPYVLYWGPGDLPNSQFAAIVAQLQAAGVTLMTNSGLVNFLTAKTQVYGTYDYAYAPDGSASGGMNFAPTTRSPTLGKGATLSSTCSTPAQFCASLPYDLNGVMQPQTWVNKSGWDIGSQALVPLYLGLRPIP